MKKLLPFLGCALTVLASATFAADITETVFARGLRKLAEDTELRRNESPLQNFFVFDDLPSDGAPRRIVYWPESRRLLRMPVYQENDESYGELILLADLIDLEADLVQSSEEIGSSTYLELESEVMNAASKCLGGKRVTIALPRSHRKRPPQTSQLDLEDAVRRYSTSSRHSSSLASVIASRSR